MNRDHEQVVLEGGPSELDRFSIIKSQLDIHGSKLKSNVKWALVLRRLVWLMLALLVLLAAVVVRVKIPLPVNESRALTAGNMPRLLINLTNS